MFLLHHPIRSKGSFLNIGHIHYTWTTANDTIYTQHPRQDRLTLISQKDTYPGHKLHCYLLDYTLLHDEKERLINESLSTY